MQTENKMPRNAVTGKYYKNTNTILLSVFENYAVQDYAGFKQWESVGRKIRKGEKAISIVTIFEKKLPDGTVKKLPSSVHVFNIAQTEIFEGVRK